MVARPQFPPCLPLAQLAPRLFTCEAASTAEMGRLLLGTGSGCLLGGCTAVRRGWPGPEGPMGLPTSRRWSRSIAPTVI